MLGTFATTLFLNLAMYAVFHEIDSKYSSMVYLVISSFIFASAIFNKDNEGSK